MSSIPGLTRPFDARAPLSTSSISLQEMLKNIFAREEKPTTYQSIPIIDKIMSVDFPDLIIEIYNSTLGLSSVLCAVILSQNQASWEERMFFYNSLPERFQTPLVCSSYIKRMAGYNFPEVIRAFNQIIEKEATANTDNLFITYITLANAMGSFEEVSRVYDLALSLGKQNAQIHANYIKAAGDAEKFEQAKKVYWQQVSSGNDSRLMHRNYIQLSKNNQDDKEATNAYQAALEHGFMDEEIYQVYYQRQPHL